MADLIDRQAVQEMVDRIGGMYPYRQIGNSDSYSRYNEVWTDAINRVDAELNSLPSAQQEIIWCKDCRKHNVHSGYKDDCCPLYEWRGMSYGHEHDYQYCIFAERREDV